MGLVTRQHKICNLKPDKHVNFLASLPDVFSLWPTHSFSFNLFICPSSVTNVEPNMLKEGEKSKEKWEKEGLCVLLARKQPGGSSEVCSLLKRCRGHCPRRELSQVNKPTSDKKVSQGGRRGAVKRPKK